MRNLLIAFFSIIASTSFGQDVFSGKIEMKIELSGEDADQMAAFMPESYTMYFSKGKMRFQINGGMMAAMMGYFLMFDGDSYMIKDSEEKAYKFLDEADSSNTNEPVPTFVKTSETEKILGYNCTKYKQVVIEDGKEIASYFWVTTEINVPNNPNGQATGGIFHEGLNGFTMKMSTTFEGITMTTTVSKINTDPVDPSVFEIPEGYEIEELEPANMFGGMGR